MNSDYIAMLNCPKCGARSTTMLFKLAGPKMIIKLKCPNHGGRVIKVPYAQKDYIVPYIRPTIFQCFKCGQEAALDHVKVSGPWSLIKCNCPTHGIKLPYLKISTSIYNEIMAGGAPQIVAPRPTAPRPIAPQPTVPTSNVATSVYGNITGVADRAPQIAAPQPAQPDSILSEKIKFCPECGSAIEGEEKFCASCGTKLY